MSSACAIEFLLIPCARVSILAGAEVAWRMGSGVQIKLGPRGAPGIPGWQRHGVRGCGQPGVPVGWEHLSSTGAGFWRGERTPGAQVSRGVGNAKGCLLQAG